MNCIVITGSRDWTEAEMIWLRLQQEPEDTVFIEGGATGVDRIVAAWCHRWHRNHIQVRANWERYGRSAGAIRNRWMLDMKPRLVIAFWKNNSPGTGDCIHQAEALGIPVEKHIR